MTHAETHVTSLAILRCLRGSCQPGKLTSQGIKPFFVLRNLWLAQNEALFNHKPIVKSLITCAISDQVIQFLHTHQG